MTEYEVTSSDRAVPQNKPESRMQRKRFAVRVLQAMIASKPAPPSPPPGHQEGYGGTEKRGCQGGG